METRMSGARAKFCGSQLNAGHVTGGLRVMAALAVLSLIRVTLPPQRQLSLSCCPTTARRQPPLGHTTFASKPLTHEVAQDAAARLPECADTVGAHGAFLRVSPPPANMRR